MIKIAPSILSADFSRLGEQVRLVEEAGAEYLHIDVMDGHFVPNITIGPLVMEALRPHSKMVFDCHLMIENADRFIPNFIKAGADLICVHQEAGTHLHRTVQLIKEAGVKAAVALNPATSPETLRYLLPDLDMVLVMSVNPGFGGQKFISGVLPKIRELRRMMDEAGLTVDIQVDGGVNRKTIQEVVSAGANILVAGSAVFGAEDIPEEIRTLRKLAEEAWLGR